MSFNGYSEVEVDQSVLKLLAYYDMFKHPLKVNEICSRSDLRGVLSENVKNSLDQLNSEGLVHKEGEYYSLKYYSGAVNNRKDGELRASKLMIRAKWFSSLIYFFPFVRAVFISGSLSKGTVPEDADIDYFIITKKNRLWIARTFLVMFKRVFLLNSKKYFCTNYFVDEVTLEIPDKNIFTATEVSTLIPMKGNGYYEKFIQTNDWYRTYFPNLEKPVNTESGTGIGKQFSKGILEPLFFNAMAEKLEKFFMKKTYRRWMNIYGQNYTDDEFELAFRSRRGTSKNHDKNYQKKVLNAIDQNMKKVLKQMKKETAND